MRLEVEIGGSASGLDQAANRAFGILENLQRTADNLKIDLFRATDVNTLNATGGALTAVTGKIREYTTAAIQGSTAFQSQQTIAILDSLNSKITVLTGNAQIFGDSVKNQKAQIAAYEAAISKLLANGLNPMDGKITSLKANIDSLNNTLANNAASAVASVNSQYQATGRIIPDLEAKIKRLRTAISGATDERGIVQYNIRLQAAQAELARLRALGIATGTSLTTSANSAANAARRLSGGYNAVGLEFGRIIQDAPFAANNFGAIGNNITRLVEVIPQYIAQTRAAIVANGGVATSANVARASLAGLFTGFGGVTIAISALVAGYIFYQQAQQNAKRKQDELNGGTKEYIETLKGVERAQLAGAKSSVEELNQLRILYKVYQDSNLPLKERKEAYEQLKQLQPEVFLKFEEKAALSTRKAYSELTDSIIASGKARAAVNLITKNAERQLENENKLAKLQDQETKARLRQTQLEGQAADAANTSGQAAAGYSERIKGNQKTINGLIKQQNDLKTDSNLLSAENNRLQDAAIKQLAKGGTLVDLNKPDKPKKEKTFRDTITPKVDRTTDQADLAGYEGIDLQIEKIRQKYVNLNEDITAASRKKGADLSQIETLRNQAQINESKEVTMALIGEETRVNEEIQRIRNESGIVAAESREKDLLKIYKWYDDEVIKAKGNAEILVGIEQGKQAQIEGVNEKYEKKRIEAQDKLVNKIQTITDKSFTQNENGTAKASRKIEEELQKRLKVVTEYFDELRKLYANDPMAQAALNLTQNAATQGMTAKADQAKDGGFGKELSRGVAKFGSDFFRILSNINQQADQSFSAIIGDLAKSLTDSLNDVFLNIFQKKLTAIMDKAFQSMSESQQNLAGGAALLGGVVSGATKKTSTLGQGTGGALKGAATGAIIGSVIPGLGTAIGAVVGGIAGALGGIFGASKARKQEELEKAQLAEQQKQTKLLERQNALAYTASIIGRMTTNGVVTGVEVNEFGQLTTKISGQDLLVTLDRANRSRKRGT